MNEDPTLLLGEALCTLTLLSIKVLCGEEKRESGMHSSHVLQVPLVTSIYYSDYNQFQLIKATQQGYTPCETRSCSFEVKMTLL